MERFQGGSHLRRHPGQQDGRKSHQRVSSNGAISWRESSEVSSRATRWALLCGGNYYCEGEARDTPSNKARYPNLSGCVNDVIAIETFLRSIGVPEGNITKLTASLCDGKPLEDEGAWPTYKNFVRELNRIADRAERGDLVYIHYSGHGTQRNDNTSLGMALVMTDVLAGGAYLSGYQLGVLVRKMVQEKGLRVTVVLDSCFSGGGFRSHEIPGLRTVMNQHDRTMLSSDEEADGYANEAERGFSDRDANVTMRAWISNPTGCTLLTACKENESAGEIEFGESKLMQGVFTHWMLDSLQGPGRHLPSHAMVRDHVDVQVEQMEPKREQSPQIFGQRHYEFFGNYFLGVALVDIEIRNPIIEDSEIRSMGYNELFGPVGFSRGFPGPAPAVDAVAATAFGLLGASAFGLPLTLIAFPVLAIMSVAHISRGLN